MTEIVFNARRTLNVLSADTLPRSTNSVIYLKQGKDHTQNKHDDNNHKRQEHNTTEPGGNDATHRACPLRRRVEGKGKKDTHT